MSRFAFKYPLVLLNLLWIPLWLFICLRRWHNDKFIPVSTINNFSIKSAHPNRIPQIVRALGLSALIIALARPQGIISHFQNKSGIDILLALDLSSSMQIPDFSINQLQHTSRIQAAKAVLDEFIRKRSQDRIGLVAFARYPYLVSPLTLNHPWLLKNLERLNAGMVEDGTAIGSAVAMCVNRLKNLKAKTRLIILLTDGVNNFGDISPMLAAETAETFKTKIYTIMVGNDQIFPVDEQVLVQMAEKTGGRFYKAYDIHSLKQVYQEIDQLEKTKVKMSGYNEYTEFFPLLLCLAFSLLLCEFLLKFYRYRVLS
jgi:Ca-activated chloride channel homolog